MRLCRSFCFHKVLRLRSSSPFLLCDNQSVTTKIQVMPTPFMTVVFKGHIRDWEKGKEQKILCKQWKKEGMRGEGYRGIMCKPKPHHHERSYSLGHRGMMPQRIKVSWAPWTGFCPVPCSPCPAVWAVHARPLLSFSASSCLALALYCKPLNRILIF